VSRQQRRSQARADAKRESRRQQFDRIHGEVLAAKSIRHMWLMYASNRLTPHGIDITDQSVRETLEPAFYAGVASMFELFYRVSPDDVSEDVGVEMLQRLHEELETYTRGRTGS
jgi:hypothetical protein